VEELPPRNVRMPVEIANAYRAIQARIRLLLNWLRDRTLIAIGHKDDGGTEEMLPSMWFRDDCFLHPIYADFYIANDRYKPGEPKLIRRWSGLVLRRGSVAQASISVTSRAPKAGRPEAYDWGALAEPLRLHVQELKNRNQRIEALADLVNWCIDNAQLRPNALRPKSSDSYPDPKTVKAAISRHGLDKIAGLRKEG
jgi:hypothetical protein